MNMSQQTINSTASKILEKREEQEPLLSVRDLSKTFYVGKLPLRAVSHASFDLYPGRTLGVVGESGSGKSTLARCVLRLIEPEEGDIVFEGVDLRALRGSALRAMRREMQMIFQDPLSSLNPLMTISNAVADPMKIHGIGTSTERRRRVMDLLNTVGIDTRKAEAFPAEFSGGQQQRIGVARALSLNPKLIVCDEPVSALDVSIQVQILDLLQSLQEERNIAYIFIAHNLAAVGFISHDVAVMYLGRFVELAPRAKLFATPLHPYTQALMNAVPLIPKGSKEAQVPQAAEGEIPSPINPPSGCHFHPRCPYAEERCSVEVPELRELEDNHYVSCHFSEMFL
jgi:peptide/nickel transport system ATP-binding protein